MTSKNNKAGLRIVNHFFSVKSNLFKESIDKQRANQRENKFHNFGKSEAADDKEKVASLFNKSFLVLVVLTIVPVVIFVVTFSNHKHLKVPFAYKFLKSA